MFNIFDKALPHIFIFIIIFLSSLNLVQYFQKTHIEHQSEACHNDMLAIEIGSQYRKKQEALAEQEATQTQAENIKRADSILQEDAGHTCKEAIVHLITHKPAL